VGATLALRYALDHPDRVSTLIYVSGTGLGWAWREPLPKTAAERLARHEPRLSELRVKDRTEAEDRELAILQWSAEFTGPDAMRHAEAMATPWFGINQDCYDAIWAELRQTWHESALRDYLTATRSVRGSRINVGRYRRLTGVTAHNKLIMKTLVTAGTAETRGTGAQRARAEGTREAEPRTGRCRSGEARHRTAELPRHEPRPQGSRATAPRTPAGSSRIARPVHLGETRAA
jgi:hypothetical protein